VTPETAVHLIRQALTTAFWVSAPILLIAFVVGIVINLVQVATSMQDSAFGAVPRLAAFLGGFLILGSWMLRQLATYTVLLFSDLSRYAR
jgi:flagellar biosynthesis protein FliQ